MNTETIILDLLESSGPCTFSEICAEVFLQSSATLPMVIDVISKLQKTKKIQEYEQIPGYKRSEYAWEIA